MLLLLLLLLQSLLLLLRRRQAQPAAGPEAAVVVGVYELVRHGVEHLAPRVQPVVAQDHLRAPVERRSGTVWNNGVVEVQ